MEFIATLSMLTSLIILVILVYNKDVMKSPYLILLSISVTFYMIGNYIEMDNPYLQGALVGLKIRFIGIPFIPTLWYLCVREFCGLQFKKRYTVFLFMIVPTIIAYLAFTWENNHLLLSNAGYFSSHTEGNLILVPGPLFIYRVIYQYGINFLGAFTLVACYFHGTKRFRQQIILFFASTLIPVFSVATHTVDIQAHSIDVTPYGLLLSLILFIFSLHKFSVFNLSKIVKENSMNYLEEGVLLFDRNGIYMDSNKSARKAFPQLDTIKLGTSIQEMEYLPFNSLLMNKDKIEPSCICEFTREYEEGIRTFRVSISQVYFHGKCIGYSFILNNITQLRQLLLSLEERSITDPLTGIFNRRYLFEVGTGQTENAKRSAEPLSVIMFDVDFFKNVNDSYGHVFGDYVLKTIASLTSTSLRKSDLVARYGGEEFCVLLLNAHMEIALRKAEAIRAKIAEYEFEYEGVVTQITSSFGVSTYTPGDENFLDIVKRADENLYKAKQTGRNKVG